MLVGSEGVGVGVAVAVGVGVAVGVVVGVGAIEAVGMAVAVGVGFGCFRPASTVGAGLHCASKRVINNHDFMAIPSSFDTICWVPRPGTAAYQTRNQFQLLK